MTELERKILQTFAEAFPGMTEAEKDRLLCFGEGMATMNDQEIKRIIDESYKKARALIEENLAVLHKCANLLLEREKINQAEFEALFDEV